MSKNEKLTPFLMMVVLILLIIDFAFLLVEHWDYEHRKEAGNIRWEQVEERIEKVEGCCDCGRDS